MKKGLVEVVFILDKSGSMESLTDDTIGGFNSVIAKQKDSGNDVLVSTVLFSDDSEVIFDRVNINEIKRMTKEDYQASGCTALVDAVCSSIKHISNVHKYIREEDRPEHTIFFITTDGMENASHKYTSENLKKMIKEKEEIGWEFMFLAANIDAFATAVKFGFRKDRTANYIADAAGSANVYETMAESICDLSTCGAIKANRMDKVNRDYKERGHR